MVAQSFSSCRLVFCQSSNAAKLRRVTPDVLSGKSACRGSGGPHPVKGTTQTHTHTCAVTEAHKEERPLSRRRFLRGGPTPSVIGLHWPDKQTHGRRDLDWPDGQTNKQTDIQTSPCPIYWVSVSVEDWVRRSIRDKHAWNIKGRKRW